MKSTPKIAIDARMVSRSGIGTCIQHWLKDVGYSVTLGDPKDLEDYKDCVPAQIPFISGIYGYKEQLKFPYCKLRKAKPDILHIPHCNVPLFYRGKMMVTIHDLTHLVYPEFLPSKIVHLYFKFIFWFVCKRANHIMTDSESTKNDLIRFYKADASKMTVVPLGVLNKLLEGFACMQGREDCRLVLVGKAFDGRTQDTREKDLGIEELTIHAGMVSQEDLVNLYNLADLFVLPSLYEGFGLPVLEAFACGTPVACSHVSSLPEVGGDVAKYFDPKNPESIARTLERSIDDKGKYDKEIDAWVSKFTWENSAKQIREIATELAAK